MHRFWVALLRTIMGQLGRRSSPALRRFIVVMGALHLGIYRRSRGLLGRRLGLRSARILMLTTTGRLSGEPRTVPLLTIADGDDWAVIASHGGLDEPPAWCLNLRAESEAIVELAGRRFGVRAEQSDPERHAELWPRFVEAFAGYEDYRRRTTRELPIMILHRTV